MIVNGLSELRRRRVLRTLGLYLFGAWAVLAILDGVSARGGLSAGAAVLVAWMLAAMLPVALAFSWLFRWTHEGLALEHVHDGTPPRTWFGRTLDVVAVIGGLAGAVGLFALIQGGFASSSDPSKVTGLFAPPA